jgi:YhcH/YjgK/YiaL family protein
MKKIKTFLCCFRNDLFYISTARRILILKNKERRMAKKWFCFLIILWSCIMIVHCSKTETTPVKKADMVAATLAEADQYLDLHPNFVKAFEFLREENLADLEPGRYDVLGDSVFCLISKGLGKSRDEAKLEAHKKYIDIQYVISGDEEMGWRPVAECSDISEPYSDEKDIMFFNDEVQVWTKVPPGSFVIFFPKDAHAPMVGEGEIHKVVCKILI